MGQFACRQNIYLATVPRHILVRLLYMLQRAAVLIPPSDIIQLVMFNRFPAHWCIVQYSATYVSRVRDVCVPLCSFFLMIASCSSLRALGPPMATSAARHVLISCSKHLPRKNDATLLYFPLPCASTAMARTGVSSPNWYAVELGSLPSVPTKRIIACVLPEIACRLSTLHFLPRRSVMR